MYTRLCEFRQAPNNNYCITKGAITWITGCTTWNRKIAKLGVWGAPMVGKHWIAGGGGRVHIQFFSLALSPESHLHKDHLFYAVHCKSVLISDGWILCSLSSTELGRALDLPPHLVCHFVTSLCASLPWLASPPLKALLHVGLHVIIRAGGLLCWRPSTTVRSTEVWCNNCLMLMIRRLLRVPKGRHKVIFADNVKFSTSHTFTSAALNSAGSVKDVHHSTLRVLKNAEKLGPSVTEGLYLEKPF